jgi:glycosyltransferase involved in cell wall biosynthesis
METVHPGLTSEPKLRETPAEQPPGITVLVPVLDEQDTVGSLAEQVAETLDAEGRSFEVVFVDDGSRDDTASRIREARERDPRVKLVRLRHNFGKAAALTAGVDNSVGSIVITMDGDLQDDPREIPRLLRALEEEGLDLVSGWKRKRRDSMSKRILSRVFNWVTRRMAGVDLHDFNCGFKAYRREVLEQVSLYGELHRYIPVLASRRGFRVGELSVEHHPRRHGSSKYGWDRIYKGPLDLLTVLFITRYTPRPLHLFGILGGLLTFAGLLVNSYLAFGWVFQERSLSNRPVLLLGVLLMVLGLQVLTTGLLAEMITLKSFRSSETYSIRELLN